jgi:hypothetical protein
MMSRKPWRLKRTAQCAKCPWRRDVNPTDIPNGYDIEKHRALRGTIAVPGDFGPVLTNEPLRVMACHDGDNDHCIGWLVNQLGPGNNLALRLHMRDCVNGDKIRLRGEQHATFDDTLPP